MPELSEGVDWNTIELPSGYQVEYRQKGFFIRRYLWPGDWDEKGILPEILEEACQAFYKVFLLYCREEGAQKEEREGE